MLSRLSSRSAMFSDLHLLLSKSGEPDGAPLKELILVQNALGKSTAAARRKALMELNGRYSFDSSVFGHFLREWRASRSPVEQALVAFVLFALNDRTVMVASCEWLFPHLQRPSSELRPGDLEAFLLTLARNSHPEIGEWSPGTLARVARHYLASIRDFGLAKGGSRKISVKPALYAGPVRLLIAAAQLAGCPADQIIRHEAFKILGIAPEGVLDALSSLHGRGALHFRMQADLIELSL